MKTASGQCIYSITTEDSIKIARHRASTQQTHGSVEARRQQQGSRLAALQRRQASNKAADLWHERNAKPAELRHQAQGVVKTRLCIDLPPLTIRIAASKQAPRAASSQQTYSIKAS